MIQGPNELARDGREDVPPLQGFLCLAVCGLFFLALIFGVAFAVKLLIQWLA